MKAETEFQNKVIKTLRAIPDSWWEKITQLSTRGTPDILGCLNGRFIALELKRNDLQKPEPLQLHKLNAIKKSGGLSFCVTPENWVFVLEEIKLASRW